MTATRDEPSAAKSRAMAAQAEQDTGPELALRRELHRRGLRYRVHRSIVPGTRRRVDIVFGPSKVAVDVRGCFWHGCPDHATWPATNAAWWRQKIEKNRDRDRDTEHRLEDGGWALVVVWEHEAPSEAAERVERLVRSRRPAAAHRS